MYFCVHFPKENVQLCKNAFDAKMHLMPKCILATQRITFSKGKCSAKQNVTNAFDALQKCIFASNAFDAKMHFCNATQRVHFPKENVQLCKNAVFFALQKTKMRTFCFAEHFPLENVRVAKMHFCIKCIFASNAFLHQQNVTNAFDAKMHFCNAYILRSQMFSITFSKVKCSASHFPKENVQRTFSKGKCSAKQNVTNAFDAKMHLMQKCILATQRNAVQKCIFASHFPKENVQHNIFQRKMFSKTKCYKYIFAKQRKAMQNAYTHGYTLILLL